MGTSIYLSPARKVRSGAKKVEAKIIRSYLVNPFSIAFEFSTGKIKRIDFLPLFHKYVKGENLKYLNPSVFRKYKVNDDRIFWGKNEDIVFSIPTLLEKQDAPDDILYIF